MRICYLAAAESIHTRRWLKFFAERGHEVSLISLGITENETLGNINLYTLKTVPPQLRVISRFPNLLTNMIQTRCLIKELNPDLLHAHFITNYGKLGLLSGFHPFVVSAWGSDILVDSKRSGGAKWMTRQVLRKADLITCDGQNTGREMMELGANCDKIVLVLHGVNLAEFNPARNDETLRNDLQISDSPVVACFTSSLHPKYDVETLIRSIPLVLEQVPRAKFLITGEGEQLDMLMNLAKVLDIQDSVRFVGKLPHDRLPYYLTLADVFVRIPLSEGGIAVGLLEAMACGVAPIVTDVGDYRSWIRNGENGFVIPVRNQKELADRIIRLLGDEHLRRNMENINLELVKERADYEREMRKMEGLYEGLIGGKKK